jgi:hypothetical protein
MFEIITKALGALWQVALVGVVLGAGLPALFAVGVRALNSGGTVTAGGPQGDTETYTATTGGRTIAYVCFGICVLAALFGIVVIVFGKQLFGV